MKNFKYIKIILVLVLSVCAAVMLLACDGKPNSSSSYYRTVKENGTEKTYVLTIDESSNTFSIVDEIGEKSYSGTFLIKNGYLILESKAKGTEYVKILGNNFSYFVPDENSGTPCTHSYVKTDEVTGNCTAKGYIEYTCSLCGDVKKESTVIGEHKYVQVSYTPGNCKSRGYKTMKCCICNDPKVTETIYDPAYGDHKLTDELRVDSGCLTQVVMRRRCTLCEKIFDEPTGEFGAHRYTNGVCTVCSFDEIGLCHKHEHVDKGVCDDCGGFVAALDGIKTDGYYIASDGTLYMGAYPTANASYTAEQITQSGKYDSVTGYYRFNGASYLVSEKNGNKRAFLVTALTWTPTDINGETYYVCTSLITQAEYLSHSKILTVYKTTDYGKTEEYYIKSQYSQSTSSGPKANDFVNSDLYAFLNNTFKNKVFTEAQRELVSSVTIPTGEEDGLTVSVQHNNGGSSKEWKVQITSYAAFSGISGDIRAFFTKSAGSVGNKVIIIPKSDISGNDPIEGLVTEQYGVVPLIKLDLE